MAEAYTSSTKPLDAYAKRYFEIDQHLARYFVNYIECFSSLPPFL